MLAIGRSFLCHCLSFMLISIRKPTEGSRSHSSTPTGTDNYFQLLLAAACCCNIGIASALQSATLTHIGEFIAKLSKIAETWNRDHKAAGYHQTHGRSSPWMIYLMLEALLRTYSSISPREDPPHIVCRGLL